MIVFVASYKGGVAKTTTAIHVADYLSNFAPTLVVDHASNRSAVNWHSRGQGQLRFPVISGRQPVRQVRNKVRNYEHIVIDTMAGENDINGLVRADLIIVPTTPDILGVEATLQTVELIEAAGGKHFCVLLAIAPPAPSHDGEQARSAIEKAGVPLFKTWVRSFVAFKRAALMGCVVGEVSGDSHAADGAADYLALGREIIKSQVA